jgi:hypothetical protein
VALTLVPANPVRAHRATIPAGSPGVLINLITVPDFSIRPCSVALPCSPELQVTLNRDSGPTVPGFELAEHRSEHGLHMNARRGDTDNVLWR